MPMYEYRCDACGNIEDRFVPIRKRDYRYPCSGCLADLHRVPAAPALGIWDSSRSFPISPTSDGMTFPSKQAYQDHLTAEGISEIATDAPSHKTSCVKWSKNYGVI